MNEDLQLAVKRGAYAMDSYLPDWATTIHLESFKMSECQHCIVGQAMGDYSKGLAAVSGFEVESRASFEWAVENGFDISLAQFGTLEAAHEAYCELETLWTEQVRERLGDAS